MLHRFPDEFGIAPREEDRSGNGNAVTVRSGNVFGGRGVDYARLAEAAPIVVHIQILEVGERVDIRYIAAHRFAAGGVNRQADHLRVFRSGTVNQRAGCALLQRHIDAVVPRVRIVARGPVFQLLYLETGSVGLKGFFAVISIIRVRQTVRNLACMGSKAVSKRQRSEYHRSG